MNFFEILFGVGRFELAPNFILQFTFICNSLIHIIQSISCINLYGGLLQKVIIAVDGIRCCQNIHGFFLIFYFDEFKNFQKIILFSMQYLHTHASYLHFTYMWSKIFTYYLHENFWKHILLRVEHILFLCLSLGQFKICNEKKIYYLCQLSILLPQIEKKNFLDIEACLCKTA